RHLRRLRDLCLLLAQQKRLLQQQGEAVSKTEISRREAFLSPCRAEEKGMFAVKRQGEHGELMPAHFQRPAEPCAIILARIEDFGALLAYPTCNEGERLIHIAPRLLSRGHKIAGRSIKRPLKHARFLAADTIDNEGDKLAELFAGRIIRQKKAQPLQHGFRLAPLTLLAKTPGLDLRHHGDGLAHVCARL